SQANKGSEDRRDASRHFACFPAHIARAEAEGDPRSALISDLSIKGALLMTRVRLAVGDPVTLALYLVEDASSSRSVSGRVVRVERRGVDAGMWGFDVAVEFDEALTDIQDEIKSIEARQAGSFLSRVRRRSNPPPANG